MRIFPHQQAEKSPQNQHVLSILQVGSHQLQYRFFRTKKPKSHHKTNTFCPITLLDCGYGGSVGALKAMGALRMGLDESEFKPLVDGLPLDADGYECAFYMKD